MVLTVSKSCVAKNASGHLGFQFFTEKRTESLGHFKTFNFKLKTLKNSLNRTLKHLLKNQLKVQKVKNSMISANRRFLPIFIVSKVVLG